MIKTCVTCDNFRYFVKPDERIVWCDLILDRYQVSDEVFEKCFNSLTFCDNYSEMTQDSEQEMK